MCARWVAYSFIISAREREKEFTCAWSPRSTGLVIWLVRRVCFLRTTSSFFSAHKTRFLL